MFADDEDDGVVVYSSQGVGVPLPPYASSSATSQAAAQSMVPTAPTLRLKVLNFIQSTGDIGATCDEVERALNLKHQTASARVHELVKLSKIAGDGKRRTSSGRYAVVYKVVL